MRIVIHNSFIGEQAAENELSRRISLAAMNLGWEVIETKDVQEIDLYQPDFVMVTHFNTPKLSQFPTYGCMWNPPVFFDRYEEFTGGYTDFDKIIDKHANILSYDAYLSSSTKFDGWLSHQLDKTAKKYFITPFFTSCNQTNYISPKLEEPQLVYIGSNWDGSRFKKLFKQLDPLDFMQVYGNKWDYLKKSYKGIIPFDGVSVLNTLRNAGVGLCLHRPEHCEAEMPSMRIFEIVASGAIAICSEHQFIRTTFGDSVLYIDADISSTEQVKQIVRHMEWIRSHPQEALEMSKQAHDIFLDKYTLEKLMLSIIPHHQKLIRDKGFITDGISIQSSQRQVEFIVRVGDRSLQNIKRCLDSIANQTYQDVSVILVQYKHIEGLSELLNNYHSRILIKTIHSQSTGFRSTQLKDGLNAITADYFAILDDDDLIYPNHTYLLVSLLEKYKFTGIAYSGATRVEENLANDMGNAIAKKDLAYFCDFDIQKLANFKNFITSNSFVARASLLDDLYKCDPKLLIGEDFYLILNLCCKSIFLFSCEVTNEFYWRTNRKDNTTFQYENMNTEVDEILSSDPNKVGESLLQLFWEKDLMYIDNYKVAFQSMNPEIKVGKLSKIRYSKYRRFNVFSSFYLYGFLRKVYLRISKGGKYNKNPSLLAKMIIKLKDFLLR